MSKQLFKAIFVVDYREDAYFNWLVIILHAKAKFLKTEPCGHQYSVIGTEYTIRQLSEYWYPSHIEAI